MEKPYIKKIADVSGIAIWLVDGRHIRDNIDVEFSNFGQHYRFGFIPVNEFWIDLRETTGEESFYIEHLLIEHKLMAEGLGYNEAADKANLAEKKMRKKALMAKFGIAAIPKKEISVQMVHKEMLECYSKNIKVWTVDGSLVRDIFFVDFTQGGHDLVYEFIPKDEIWLDDSISERERKFVLLHELHERRLMSQGKDYPSSHIESSDIEYYCRQHPEEIDAKLQEELVKSNSSANGAAKQGNSSLIKVSQSNSNITKASQSNNTAAKAGQSNSSAAKTDQQPPDKPGSIPQIN